MTEAKAISDRAFTRAVFHPYPALVSRQAVDGHRMWKPHHGGEYDESQFELVPGMWDHEHCFICNFKIKDGYTYWANGNEVNLVCDECYEFYFGD